MKIPGQEVPDAEKALLEKTSKLEDLLKKQKLELSENEGDRDRTGICLL